MGMKSRRRLVGTFHGQPVYSDALSDLPQSWERGAPANVGSTAVSFTDDDVRRASEPLLLQHMIDKYGLK